MKSTKQLLLPTSKYKSRNIEQEQKQKIVIPYNRSVVYHHYSQLYLKPTVHKHIFDGLSEHAEMLYELAHPKMLN